MVVKSGQCNKRIYHRFTWSITSNLVCYWLHCSTRGANIYPTTNAKGSLEIKVGQNRAQPSVKNSYRLAGHLHSTSTTAKQKWEHLQSSSNDLNNLGFLWKHPTQCYTKPHKQRQSHSWDFASTHKLVQKSHVARGRHLHLIQIRVVPFLDLNQE